MRIACSAERRARIRAGQIANRDLVPMHWDDVAKERLCEAFERGGYPEARAAFPKLRPGQVNGAVRRYCLTQKPQSAVRRAYSRSDSPWGQPDFQRRWDAVFSPSFQSNS